MTLFFRSQAVMDCCLPRILVFQWPLEDGCQCHSSQASDMQDFQPGTVKKQKYLIQIILITLFYDRLKLTNCMKEGLTYLCIMSTSTMLQTSRYYSLIFQRRKKGPILFQPCQCNEIGFGRVDEILGSRYHNHTAQHTTQMFFHTADLVGKVSITQQNVELNLAYFE